MKPEQRQLFREALLRVLDDNNTRVGMTVRALGVHVASYGFSAPSETEIKSEIQYLEDKQLVAEVLKGISPENRSWRITAGGRDFVANLTS